MTGQIGSRELPTAVSCCCLPVGLHGSGLAGAGASWDTAPSPRLLPGHRPCSVDAVLQMEQELSWCQKSPAPSLCHGRSLYFPTLCLPLLHGSLPSVVSDSRERFPPSHCKPQGCDLVSCSLRDLRQAASQWCFRLQQQAGHRNHHEPVSHGKTGPKLLDTVVGQAVFWVVGFFFSYGLVQKFKHLDRDFVNADAVYIGLSPPRREALASFWQSSLQKGTCFVSAMLHNRRTYSGAIKAFSCILKHFPFFTWITTIKENNITYLNLN